MEAEWISLCVCVWWWELCGFVNTVSIKFAEWPLTTRSHWRKLAGPEVWSTTLKNVWKDFLLSLILFSRVWFIATTLAATPRVLFSPQQQKLWIPRSLLNCYSLCLSRTGMCFGKFSTPLRPSRKKEAYRLLLQNASLASARLMPRKQRPVCLCGGVQEFCTVSPWLTHIIWSLRFD